MSKFKIVCFSFLAILLFFFSIETLARFYWYAKYGNSNVLFYGFNKGERYNRLKKTWNRYRKASLYSVLGKRFFSVLKRPDKS